MRTVTYKSVLDRIAGYLAQPDGLGTEDVALITAKVQMFVRLGWEYYWWPELMAVERRTFRARWRAETTYAATAWDARVEVFDPATREYYQSLQAGNTGNPPTIDGVENSAWWAKCEGEYGADNFDAGKDYTAGDQARDPETGWVYQCIAPVAGTEIETGDVTLSGSGGAVAAG